MTGDQSAIGASRSWSERGGGGGGQPSTLHARGLIVQCLRLLITWSTLQHVTCHIQSQSKQRTGAPRPALQQAACPSRLQVLTAGRRLAHGWPTCSPHALRARSPALLILSLRSQRAGRAGAAQRLAVLLATTMKCVQPTPIRRVLQGVCSGRGAQVSGPLRAASAPLGVSGREPDQQF